MTDDYWQKLLNWSCSVTLISAFAALGPLVCWFIDLPRWGETEVSLDLAIAAAQLGETLLIYPVLFPIILFWHFWDFVRRTVRMGRLSDRLSSYWPFLMSILAAGVLWLLMSTGLFTINSCDAVKGALHFECFIHEPDWLMIPFLLTLFLALSLCVAKAAVSVGSYLKETA